MDLLINSAGGVGCSYVMSYLKNNTSLKLNCERDSDKFKHISAHNFSKLAKTGAKKCLFIISDPAMSIDSHYRRRWVPAHSKKLLSHPIKMSKQEYYQQVIQSKKDMFGIEKQFDAWTKDREPTDNYIDVLFIDFHSIKEHKEQIAKFIGCFVGVFNDFRYRNRHANHKHLHPEYKKVYDNLYQKMLQFNGVEKRIYF